MLEGNMYDTDTLQNLGISEAHRGEGISVKAVYLTKDKRVIIHTYRHGKRMSNGFHFANHQQIETMADRYPIQELRDLLKGEFEILLQKFLRAGEALSAAWDESKVKHYPPYLPSFDEFLHDFSGLVDGLKEWPKRVGIDPMSAPNAAIMRRTYENNCPQYYSGVTEEQWDAWEKDPKYICLFCSDDVNSWCCPRCKEYKGVMPYFPTVDYGWGKDEEHAEGHGTSESAGGTSETGFRGGDQGAAGQP